MQTKTVYRTKYNAHGQIEKYGEAVTLYGRKAQGYNPILQAVYTLITLAVLVGMIGGIIWIVSIVG